MTRGVLIPDNLGVEEVLITADYRDHHDKIRKLIFDLGNGRVPFINIAINIIVNIANVIDFKIFYI